MSLKDYDVKTEYRSLKDNVVQQFYVPLLRDASSYKRAVGFFSSSALIEISKGIAGMARRGGKIKIIASPYLSDEDIDAIKEGYEKREQIIEGALLRELSDDHTDRFSKERLNLLANLIADGVLDIKIAFTDHNGYMGMYHEKMGIITDSDGNQIAFSGSMNDSVTSMSFNYETIDVFCDWKGKDDAGRVALKNKAFDAMWENSESGLEVMEFSKITEAMIKKYRFKEPDYEIDNEQFGKEDVPPKGEKNNEDDFEPSPLGPRVPKDVSLFDYQLEAITSWVGENYRGIFDMATGTGKTYTGLGAIAKLSEDLDDKLAVFIAAPFQHLVEQWVEDIRRFHMDPIIAYSGSKHKDWKERLSKAIRDQKVRSDKPFFCFVSTNDTFASAFVQEQIKMIKSQILLVVDEAHNIGARTYAKCLDDRFTYRLALSATFERFRDEEGTALLYKFFGRKCLEYPLERAIREDKLTPYYYYPILVYLNDFELESYEMISFEMSKCLIKGKDGKPKLNKQGEILAIKRSRIVAGAINKLDALREAIGDYKDKHNILVYCGATRVPIEYENEKGLVDDFDIRQIEAVTSILGNEFGMSVSRFTSGENIETRQTIKEKFNKGELQAIVAIKCLDEGMNIPGINTAFILASTTNPKEYIQRRGRVLRKAKNKPYAKIYDFVTLPRPLDIVSSLTEEQANRDKTLVRNELNRIKEFGRLAINSLNANKLIWEIEDAYHLEPDDSEMEIEGGEYAL